MPGEVLDLTNWNLTLPTGNPGKPTTVQQPDLGSYSSEFFQVDDAEHAVVFTTPAGGVTTKNSSYPRSELREMNGEQEASWSNTSGTHTLEVREAVMALPTAKPDVVTAQIHDSEDDVVEIRLEGTRLTAQYDDGDGEVMLDPAYRLGTAYDLRMIATNGSIQIFYNGTAKADIAKSGNGWYFKAGSYIQSNESKGDRSDAEAVVVIYALTATHST